MNQTARASRTYLTQAVMTASSEQLQLMLIDGAIRYTLKGREAIERKEIEGAFNSFDRAQRILIQLRAGLQREVNPTLVDEMSRLYDFIYRRLIDANVGRDVAAADDALKILRHHRETWVLLMERVAGATAEKKGSGAPPPEGGLSIEC